jgi:hypothetical protein
MQKHVADCGRRDVGPRGRSSSERIGWICRRRRKNEPMHKAKAFSSAARSGWRRPGARGCNHLRRSTSLTAIRVTAPGHNASACQARNWQVSIPIVESGDLNEIDFRGCSSTLRRFGNTIVCACGCFGCRVQHYGRDSFRFRRPGHFHIKR